MTAKEKAKLRVRIIRAKEINRRLNEATGALTEALIQLDELKRLCPTMAFIYLAQQIDTANMHVVNAQAANELKITDIRGVYGESSNS